MQRLLEDWDDKDDDQEFVDSDDDSDDDAAMRKKALLKKTHNDDSDEEDEEGDDDDDEEDEEEEDEENEQEAEADEEEESDEEEEEEEEEAAVQAESDDEEEEGSEEEEAAAEAEESEEEDEDEEEEQENDDDEEDEEEEEEDEEEEVANAKTLAVDDSEEEAEEEPENANSVELEEDATPFKVTTPTTDIESDNDDNMTVDTMMTSDPTKDKLKKKPKKSKPKKTPKKVSDPQEGDTEEDAAMKALLASWDADNGIAEDDEEDEEEADANDSDSEAEEREVILEDNVIDHLVLAGHDLEASMKEFHLKTGLEPVIAGTIKGLGIKCARISFNDATYLEIIAPDPKGPGPIGELIKKQNFKELTPFHWAVRTRHTEELKDEVGQFGYTPDHITMFGSKPDGTPRKWEMLYLYGHKMGGTCPFFINWANSDHPCATLPIVGKLRKVTIRAPEDDPVHQLLDHVHVKSLQIEEGKRKFSFSFKCPEGTVKFSTDKAVGFKFPGFEADVGAIPGDEGEQDAEVVFDDPKLPELLPVSDMEYEELPPAAY